MYLNFGDAALTTTIKYLLPFKEPFIFFTFYLTVVFFFQVLFLFGLASLVFNNHHISFW